MACLTTCFCHAPPDFRHYPRTPGRMEGWRRVAFLFKIRPIPGGSHEPHGLVQHVLLLAFRVGGDHRCIAGRVQCAR